MLTELTTGAAQASTASPTSSQGNGELGTVFHRIGSWLRKIISYEVNETSTGLLGKEILNAMAGLPSTLLSVVEAIDAKITFPGAMAETDGGKLPYCHNLQALSYVMQAAEEFARAEKIRTCDVIGRVVEDEKSDPSSLLKVTDMAQAIARNKGNCKLRT